MYYDNKSTFYIKQYGPAVLVITFSLILVFGGLYIYLSSNKYNKPQSNLVAKNINESNTTSSNNNIEQSNSLKEVENIHDEKNQTATQNNDTKTIDINKIKFETKLSNELRSMNVLDKVSNVKVIEVMEDKQLAISINDKYYKISLIGVDYAKSNNNIIDTLKNDLVGKDVKIAFDKVKIQDNNIYAYIYINDELYNETILKNGLAIVKVEKANTSLLDNLINAQLTAKKNLVGIWKK